MGRSLDPRLGGRFSGNECYVSRHCDRKNERTRAPRVPTVLQRRNALMEQKPVLLSLLSMPCAYAPGVRSITGKPSTSLFHDSGRAPSGGADAFRAAKRGEEGEGV